ncbi:MAG: PQQ-binding-like beta-propeller repeat protein [Planctomycetota bacterium]|nr:PQQ-binding-like beta-propeller repeat protein [Planctomycetota bacterium]
MLRRYAIASLAALWVCVGSDLFAQVGRSPLISEIQAQRNGLTRAWFVQLQMDSRVDRLETVQLYNLKVDPGEQKNLVAAQPEEVEALLSLLVAQTRRGVIQLLDAETGKSFWSVSVGSPGSYTSAPGVNGKYVAVTNGSTLYVYDRANGSLAWKKSVVKAPGAGLALSDHHVCLATTSGILEVHNLDDPADPPWQYHAGGHGFVQPLTTSGSVSWGNDRGLFYVIATDQLRLRFWMAAQDEIVAAPAHLPPNFYVGSRDGYLYKVHERKGTVAWRFSTGEPIVHRPIAVDGFVYVTTQHGGLYCVRSDLKVMKYVAETARQAAKANGEESPKAEDWDELEEGTEVWFAPGIRKLLAVTPTRIYGLDKEGRLRILRRDTGALISVMPTENQTFSVLNHATDRLYLGTKTGLIQCLHEPALDQPLQYVMTDEVKEVPVKIEQGAVEDGEGADKPKDVEDLFGGDDDDNPFGEAPADGDADDADSPFGGGDEADDDDPFG